MSFQFFADETIEAGIKRILLEKLDESIKLLNEPGDDFDAAVHEARKNCKRMRAVLRLVRDEIGPDVFERENKAIRDASRRLAPMRDSWVMVETVNDLKEAHALTAEAFAGIQSKLLDHYAKTKAKFVADTSIVPEVVAEFTAARRRVVEMPIGQNDFSTLRKGIKRVYKRGRESMRLSYSDKGDAEVFHEWRKRVKYLWYQMEILHEIWPVVMAEVAEELHEISTLIGDAHDAAVLRETLLGQPEHFAEEADLTRLLNLAEQRRLALEEEARPLGERMFAERPRNFANRLASYWRVWRETGFNGLPAAEFES